jgi:hypothetical protein
MQPLNKYWETEVFTLIPGKILTATVSALLVATASLPIMANELLLGDGKVSSTPQVGYLMSCTQDFRQGAAHGGPWIHGDQWDPSEKPHVQGSVDWPTHQISITIEGGERVISANNLPDHVTGTFPISPTDPAYQYDRNPNAIQPQNILLKLPLNPQPAAEPSCVPMGMIGFSVDGVAIYNAVDASGRDAAAHEIQDRCDGHPQRSGQYHYHSPSPCMPNEMTAGLVGYALDGFGIYGMRDPATGKIMHDGDLDACHGITSPVMWDGKRIDMYHYALTPEYPYSVGCYRGTPVMTGLRSKQSQQRMPEMGRNPATGGDQQQDSRRQRLERAADILGVSPQELREALGPPPPDLRAAAQKLGVSVQALRDALGPPPNGGGQ